MTLTTGVTIAEQDKKIDTLIDSMDDEAKHILRVSILAEKARRFTADGFEAFFYLLTDMKLPAHQVDAIQSAFDAYEIGKGIVIEMFRGAAKTTVFNNALGAFLIGHFPEKTGLLIQVGDDIATDNSSTIAGFVEHNPGFNLVFPHVVPDRNQGWGANGYHVKRTDMDYDQWNTMRAGSHDPTFVGLGYKSRAIIGKRPYWLIVDDINDENNTSSEREAIKMEKILTGTIFPAANLAEFMVVIGTPWNENDAIHYCLSTQQFEHKKVPVYTEVDGEIIYTWPEMYPPAKVQEQRNLAGDIEFYRMFLLDLERTKGLVLKKEWLHYWPNEQIYPEWPTFIGIDFTASENPEARVTDHFALAVGKVIPGKGMVIVDGMYERVTQADAEAAVVAWSAKYPTLQGVAVESIFSGDVFYKSLLTNAEVRSFGIPMIPIRFNKDKGSRYEKTLAPLFQRARVYLSDAHTKFVTAFEHEWVNWQGNKMADLGHDDALDAVYALTQAAQSFVSPIVVERNRRGVHTNPLFAGMDTKSTDNPWTSLGRR